MDISDTSGSARTNKYQRWWSPPDQPAWARPVLLLIAGAAALTYGWGLEHVLVHDYYAPAVRSMAHSWRAFLFGGFDPQASITLDKLPGALMLPRWPWPAWCWACSAGGRCAGAEAVAATRCAPVT